MLAILTSEPPPAWLHMIWELEILLISRISSRHVDKSNPIQFSSIILIGNAKGRSYARLLESAQRRPVKLISALCLG
jgi:hypothetical protein